MRAPVVPFTQPALQTLKKMAFQDMKQNKPYLAKGAHGAVACQGKANCI
jgi:hypothetical protein